MITLADRDEALLLFGQRDAYLRMIRDALGVRLVARGDTIQIEGSSEQVDQAERVFVQMRALLKSQGLVQPEEVRTALAVVQASGSPASTLGVTRDHGKGLRPRTDGQGRYVQAMRDNEIVLCIGPAGT